MGNGFSLLKFSNSLDCNRILENQLSFVGGQIFIFKGGRSILIWRKEKLQPVLLWICPPRLPLEMWNEILLRHILSPFGRLYKVAITQRRCQRVYLQESPVDVDISKPLKRKILYVREGGPYECLLDYENIRNICFRCDSQSHHFDSFVLTLRVLPLRLRNCKRYLKWMIPRAWVWMPKQCPKMLNGLKFSLSDHLSLLALQVSPLVIFC